MFNLKASLSGRTLSLTAIARMECFRQNHSSLGTTIFKSRSSSWISPKSPERNY